MRSRSFFRGSPFLLGKKPIVDTRPANIQIFSHMAGWHGPTLDEARQAELKTLGWAATDTNISTRKEKNR